jgi:hypothetical protein
MFKWPKAVIILLFQSLRLYGIRFKNVTVQNAMNIGVGISYDLSGILKNGK